MMVDAIFLCTVHEYVMQTLYICIFVHFVILLIFTFSLLIIDILIQHNGFKKSGQQWNLFTFIHIVNK